MSDTPSLPSGLVTFMFTDIVGSTDMKAKMLGATSGERQDAFLQKVKVPHETIITERVSGRDGRMVRSTGDGFLIAFADAEKAVLCGVEIQQRLSAASIFTPSGVLQVRIGINSGQAEPIANDYTASAVDKAARVENKAVPGQVYLSRETHELIRGKVRGISTASAGFHVLSGVGNEELFVAFAAPSSIATAASVIAPVKPAASSKIPNNLPRLQPFFGREEELKTIRDALDPESRTWGALIDGPGGMGKTSLAVRAAYDCPPGQFQRIIFVSVKDREMDDDGVRSFGTFILPGFLEMLNELAHELGQPDITKTPEDQRVRLLLDALRPAQALLILDNLESLSKSDRDQLFTFVKRLPPGCKAILTSRRRIGSGSEELILEQMDQIAALATLADLAQRNKLLAKTSEAERVALYKQTGGKPLLLRWVAGQLGRGSCRTFTDSLHFLRACPPDNDPLEFIFGDLVQEFAPEETRVLCSLIYFTLPAKVEHIVEVAGLDKEAVGTALGSLANRSLVVPDQEEEAFAIVPMVAEFLRRKRPDVVAETGRRLEKRAYALIIENGYEKHNRFPVLDAAWPKVASALPLFLAGPNDRLQTVCTALFQFLNFTGRWDESLSLNKQAETKAVATDDYDKAGWRAYHAGMIHSRREQADEVLACAARAAAHWHNAKVGVRERASAIRLRGLGHRLKKDYLTAITVSREVLELLRTLSIESHDVAIAMIDLAHVEKDFGDLAAAERDYREVQRLALAHAWAETATICAGNLAELALLREDWPRAETLAREALSLSKKLGRLEMIAEDCRRLALALGRQGKKAESLPYAQRAVEIYTKLNSPVLKFARATLAECEG